MRFFKIILAVLAFATFTMAQGANEAQFKVHTDSLTNEPVKIDFSKSLSGVNDPGLVFSHFANKPLLIYYFSPKCPHCRNHFPTYQNMVKEYEKKGIQGIGIAIGGNIKKNDIRMFIDQFNVSIPVFQDSEMQFGPFYGTGYVPVLFLVLPDGTFYRYESMKDSSLDHVKSVLGKYEKKN